MSNAPQNPAEWLGQLFQSQAKMLQLFTGAQPGAGTESQAPQMPGLAGLAGPWADMSKNIVAMQQDYFRQMQSFFPGFAAAAQVPQDKRFAGEAWRADPRFDAVSRSYLNYANMLNAAIDASPLDEKAKGQWSFVARQLVDAMSPANFLATNPEAMQMVIDSKGQSLVDGMSLMVQDLLKGRITMTDEGAFELGRNIATTEGAVMFENELFQLIRYTPLAEEVHERPLLMVPPCINKFYILDLQPENSLVRYALQQGHQVYLMSWRNANAEIDTKTWDDYLRDGVMKAIDVTLEASGQDKLNALGFCIGGTMLSCAVAVERAQGKDRVASVTLLTAMLDFSDTGELGLLVTEQSVAQREQAIGSKGLMKGAELALTFSSLRANDLIWPYVVNSYLKGKAPPAFDLLYWNSDATNLPGPMYCWYVRNTYLENRFRHAGETVHCGVKLDYAKIDMPAYLYASREDHIVPWQTAYGSRELLGGDTTFVLGASGHIAGVINPASKNKRNYWVGDGPTNKPEAWLDEAKSVPGSWWPHWVGWLAAHAGAKVPAPKAPSKGKYRAIEPAPGRYVMEKAE